MAAWTEGVPRVSPRRRLVFWLSALIIAVLALFLLRALEQEAGPGRAGQC